MIKDANLNFVIRAYRMALGMTQTALGDAIGKSNAFVSLYERGLTDGCGYEVDMQRVLIKELKKAQGGKEFYDAKAALILCDIYRKREGCAPLKAWKTAGKACKRFSEVALTEDRA